MPTHPTKTLPTLGARAHLPADSRFLQQVLLYFGALDGTTLVKVDVNVFAEAAGVVITDGLGIPKCCRVAENTGETG